MTPYQRRFAAAAAPKYTDPDAFASDMLTSIAFTAEDAPEIDIAPLDDLRALWRVVNMPLRDLIRETGARRLNDFADRYCVSLSAVKDWSRGDRTPPIYVRLMIAELAGLIAPPKED